MYVLSGYWIFFSNTLKKKWSCLIITYNLYLKLYNKEFIFFDINGEKDVFFCHQSIKNKSIISMQIAVHINMYNEYKSTIDADYETFRGPRWNKICVFNRYPWHILRT